MPGPHAEQPEAGGLLWHGRGSCGMGRLAAQRGQACCAAWEGALFSSLQQMPCPQAQQPGAGWHTAGLSKVRGAEGCCCRSVGSCGHAQTSQHVPCRYQCCSAPCPFPQIYNLRRNYADAYAISRYMCATRPGDLDELRDSGVFLYQLGRYPGGRTLSADIWQVPRHLDGLTGRRGWGCTRLLRSP